MKIDVSSTLTDLAKDQERFMTRAGVVDGPSLQQVFASWARGVTAAAAEVNTESAGEAAIERALQDLRGAIEHRQLSRWRNDPAIRAFVDDIIDVLASSIYAGKNPDTVARALEKRFDVHDYDWRRLARTEFTSANAQGKLQSYIRNGFLQYNWVTAPGACAICEGIKAAGPYMVGAGPMPGDHGCSSCRCSIHALTPVAAKE